MIARSQMKSAFPQYTPSLPPTPIQQLPTPPQDLVEYRQSQQTHPMPPLSPTGFAQVAWPPAPNAFAGPQAPVPTTFPTSAHSNKLVQRAPNGGVENPNGESRKLSTHSVGCRRFQSPGKITFIDDLLDRPTCQHSFLPTTPFDTINSLHLETPTVTPARTLRRVISDQHPGSRSVFFKPYSMPHTGSHKDIVIEREFELLE